MKATISLGTGLNRDCQEFRVWPEQLNLFMPLPV
jgi:hypothetical protein